ncbi:MAG: choice-of-anchor Q domain-containing protein, partial [Kofleriaceae bacterium]
LFVEDNVLVAATDAIACAQCAVNHNLTYPQTIVVGTSNIVVDPQFVSAATRDYHLTATSPAVDAASPSTGFTTTHDFDGIARPQGAGFDLGALERHP